MLDDKASWAATRAQAHLSREVVARMLARGFPGRSVVSAELMPGGLANSTLRVRLDRGSEPIVLRVYERDPAVCLKEVELLRLVGSTVPVPEVLHAEPHAGDGLPPFMLMRHVDGLTFRRLKQTQADVAQAAYAIGGVLATIGRHVFARPGWLAPGLEIGGAFFDGPDAIVQLVEASLALPAFRARVDEPLRNRLRSFARSYAPPLAPIDSEHRLVHGDFNPPNVLVRSVGDSWTVAAVLDWEFAFSGSPLIDVGNFLRYERASRPRVEPHFSRGFEDAGGRLLDDWRRLARAIDLTALCEMLGRETIADAIVVELLELVRATLDDRDPS